MPLTAFEAQKCADSLFQHAAWKDLVGHYIDNLIANKKETCSSEAFSDQIQSKSLLNLPQLITSKEDLALVLLYATEKNEECMALIAERLTENQVRKLFIEILLAMSRPDTNINLKYALIWRADNTIVKFMLKHFLRQAKHELSERIKEDCQKVADKICRDQAVQKLDSYKMSVTCQNETIALITSLNNKIIEFLQKDKRIYEVLSVYYGGMQKDETITDQTTRQEFILGDLANRIVSEVIASEVEYRSNSEKKIAIRYLSKLISRLIINPFDEAKQETLSIYPECYKNFLCDTSNREPYLDFYFSLSPDLIDSWSNPVDQNLVDQKTCGPGDKPEQETKPVYADGLKKVLPKPSSAEKSKQKVKIDNNSPLTLRSLLTEPLSLEKSERKVKSESDSRLINLQIKQLRFFAAFDEINNKFQSLIETVSPRYATLLEIVTKTSDMQEKCAKSGRNLGENIETIDIAHFEKINQNLIELNKINMIYDNALFPPIPPPYSSERFTKLIGQFVQFSLIYSLCLEENEKKLLKDLENSLKDSLTRLKLLEEELAKELVEKATHQAPLSSPSRLSSTANNSRLFAGEKSVPPASIEKDSSSKKGFHQRISAYLRTKVERPASTTTVGSPPNNSIPASPRDEKPTGTTTVGYSTNNSKPASPRDEKPTITTTVGSPNNSIPASPREEQSLRTSAHRKPSTYNPTAYLRSPR